MRCHSVRCGTASQTQLGFPSALIVERLRGQGYGDFPRRGVHFFSTAHSNKPPLRHHKVLAAAAKELQPKILDFCQSKNIIQRLNGMQDAAAHIAP
jgi:hypothetical protein